MSDKSLQCSFCGRKKEETEILIAGIDAHICDACIEQAYHIIAEERKGNKNAALSEALALKKAERN
jgi:ATP-dependent Clp protease ATP-binding subunit ClpX